MTELAKLSSKGQVTIPVKVRQRLHLHAGDTLAWDIQDDGKIIVHRVEPVDADYLSALHGTLSEWNSVEDDEAYNDL